MSDQHVIQDGYLWAFLPGLATADEELVNRVGSTLIADQDAMLGTGGGLTFALRSGKLATDASVVSQFTLAAARTKLALNAVATAPQIDRIELVDHTLGGGKLAMTVQLALVGSQHTIQFILRAG